MKANATPLLSIFDPKLRLEVPLFQRQYVWSRAHQWEPLWEDIARKFAEFLDGRQDAPVHFLGAMVLDQKFTPTTHVTRRQVIDGQQRLTTLQIFLAAYRDFCTAQDCLELAKECRSFTFNTGMMADPDVDRFKVWPTSLDRPQFIDVLTSESREALECKHPLVRRKYSKRPDPRPRMVEAYLYFYEQLSQFFIGSEEEVPIGGAYSICIRLEECLKALKSSLQVVVIDLEQGDDPQVIFETLNARGEPLLPADLLRNYIFLRAGRLNENQESLYETYWRAFDDDFWRQEVRQGRLNRPRSDQFMQHFLASRLSTDISAKHLYVEYKHWIEVGKPFETIQEELQTLARQREEFRRLIEPKKGDVLSRFATFLENFDVSTVFPPILFALDTCLENEQLDLIATHLESYILRRAFCGLTTKSYNRTFLALTKQLHSSPITGETISSFLAGLAGDSAEWPTDDVFREAWKTQHAYQVLNSSRINYLLRRLDETYFSEKNEHISISNPLTIEHILPNSWLEHWPLPDGSKGLTSAELSSDLHSEDRAEATRRRNALVHTIGNLTLLTKPLNSANSNSGWENKKHQILNNSLLSINSQLSTVESWDEKMITRRSEELFKRALKLWPHP